jgi:hypothetical protein
MQSSLPAIIIAGLRRFIWTDEEMDTLRSLMPRYIDGGNEENINWDELAVSMNATAKTGLPLNPCNRVYNASNVKQLWLRVRTEDEKKATATSSNRDRRGYGRLN